MAGKKLIGVSFQASQTLHSKLSKSAVKARRSIAMTVMLAVEEFLERESEKGA